MKTFITSLFFVVFAFAKAQDSNVYISKGYAIKGYDVVSYFTNEKPLKGDKKFQVKHDGATFLFASQENLETFNGDRDKYVPAYGGYCAYAMGKKGTKYSIDPETYEIRDGKVYLFYNKFFTNTLEKWLEEDPENLKKKADAAWKKQ